MTSLLWFGRDLRLEDHPALVAACARGGAIIPVYILDDADAEHWAAGAASRWWLHASLQALDGQLRAHGSRLILRRGAAAPVLDALLQETGADAVFWSRRYEPWAVARGQALKRALRQRGIAAYSSNAALLVEPQSLATRKGEPFRVFTPFWKALQAQDLADPAPAPPPRLTAPSVWPRSDTLADWRLQPRQPDWAAGLRAHWTPGTHGARSQLAAFLRDALAAYAEQRNYPSRRATSRLSPHLHFGELGPRQVWHAVQVELQLRGGLRLAQVPGAERFLAEIAWREFSYHLLFHFPQLPDTPLRPEFARFPWDSADGALRAWQRGQTGYPIVDAGMRELWHTGWMHNRVRMIVASFLVKDLLLPWREGARWFWDTLVDADLANNSASWQWVAGCGADAAPYFRVFNPTLQAVKFDPDGAYVRQWLPELASLPDEVLHVPWQARPVDLAAAGITLGRTYPLPLVDHALARTRALQLFAAL